MIRDGSSRERERCKRGFVYYCDRATHNVRRRWTDPRDANMRSYMHTHTITYNAAY